MPPALCSPPPLPSPRSMATFCDGLPNGDSVKLTTERPDRDSLAKAIDVPMDAAPKIAPPLPRCANRRAWATIFVCLTLISSVVVVVVFVLPEFQAAPPVGGGDPGAGCPNQGFRAGPYDEFATRVHSAAVTTGDERCSTIGVSTAPGPTGPSAEWVP